MVARLHGPHQRAHVMPVRRRIAERIDEAPEAAAWAIDDTGQRKYGKASADSTESRRRAQIPDTLGRRPKWRPLSQDDLPVTAPMIRNLMLQADPAAARRVTWRYSFRQQAP
jgi:hypothetical protein